MPWPPIAATAISRSPSSTTVRRSPAAPPPWSPAPCSMAAPGQRRALLRPQRRQQRRHRLERARRRRLRRGHRPAGQRHALPVLLALLRRQRYRLLPGQRRRRDEWPAPGERRRSHPRSAVAVPRRRQLRRQPGQWPGRRHQLGRRPDLLHHQPGRELVRHRRPGGLQHPRQFQPRPGVRRARSDGPRRRRQPGQFHLRRHREGPDFRQPGRRRQRHAATTGSISPPAWTARPSSRSSPTRPAAATTPTPSPTRASTSSPTRSPPRATRPRPGSTSPAISRPWPTPSSARATPRGRTTWRSRSPRSRPTGDTPSPTARPRGPTPSCTWAPIRACSSQPTMARRGHSSPIRATARWRRAATCRTSSITSLSLSLGDISPETGRPTLAGPDAPPASFTGNLTSGFDARHGRQHACRRCSSAISSPVLASRPGRRSRPSIP